MRIAASRPTFDSGLRSTGCGPERREVGLELVASLGDSVGVS
jgi:hypothetical protein